MYFGPASRIIFIYFCKKNRMKQLTLLVVIFLSAFSFNTNAQVNPHAIGIRGLSGNFGIGGEVSYQHGLGSSNRLEVDLGWKRNDGNNYNHSALTGIYHWVWNLTDGLNWFAGVGAQLGFYRDKWAGENDGITLGVGGQIGIEYDFNELGAPILLGLDTRPMWGLNGGVSGIGYGAAFSLRFTF
jgi:hypothetical protein